ncbi:MAG TPA: DUF1844 domain-containing protein [Candidatus Binatia bacterium]|nr:DUF1844 domain-containing protein [Candidatus Binatia bacterium]
MSDERDERAFKVEDRRRFGPDGRPRQENSDTQGAAGSDAPSDAGASGSSSTGGAAGGAPSGAPSQVSAAESAAAREDAASASEAAFEEASKAAGAKSAEITFSSFVVGLATQALMFMGAVPDPAGNPAKRNMAEASALIDILGMLERKTAGNLAEDEARLIEDVLYDLRMRYVREARRGAGGGN